MKLLLASLGIIITAIVISAYNSTTITANTTATALLTQNKSNIFTTSSVHSLRLALTKHTASLSSIGSSLLSRVPFSSATTPQQHLRQLFAPLRPVCSVSNMTVTRAVRMHFLAREQPEGDGATVRRSVGTAELRNFSPFLMLDHFDAPPGAGFPDHPHRGQETITYLLEGAVDHEDFAGNAGTIEAGDLQFMTAGRGIMHAEMPSLNHSRNAGFQLWVDLPKALKMCEPRYRDLRAKEIPTVITPDDLVTIKVISGQSHGVDSVKDLAYTPVWILDISIKPGGRVSQALPQGWNAFAYVFEGSGVRMGVDSNETIVPRFHNAVFEQDGDEVVLSNDAAATEDAKIFLVAGQPLDQPIFQYGPFVLNSRAELPATFEDYSQHKNGFERAKNWQSKIAHAKAH